MNTFESAEQVQDEKGNVCQLNHIDSPFTTAQAVNARAFTESTGVSEFSVRSIADAYLQEALPHFGLDANMLLTATESTVDANAAVANESSDQLLYESAKSVMGNSRVTYNQTMEGIPVWESGIVVQVEESPMQVIGSQSTVKRNLQLQPVRADAKFIEKKIDGEAIKKLFGIAQGDKVSIGSTRKFAYQFDSAQRIQIFREGPSGEGVGTPFLVPPLREEIVDGSAYVVSAVEFTLESKHKGRSSWLVLLEQNSGSLLLIRSLDGCVCNFGSALQQPATQQPGSHQPGIAISAANNAASAAAATDRPSVVFFDVGDTLGKPVLVGGQLSRIDIFPDAFEFVKELFEKQVRVGIISDPGSFSTDLIKSLLQDTGVLEFVDPSLIIFGAKNSKAIFESSAAVAGVLSTQCLYVGENNLERSFADQAGFKSVSSPDLSIAIVDPSASIAWVYLADPKTKVGPTGPAPDASEVVLNRHRDLVSLVGLTPANVGSNQTLTGEYIRLVNIEDPNPTLPSSPPPGDFRYSVNTNDFGAVNAYHNCDRLFRMLEGFGFDVRNYFDGTVFPVRVDHRVKFPDFNNVPTANSVNASSPGSSNPPSSDGFRFALAALNTSVGMATDWRVVLHEFGHALLWDNVGSPNFRFAHSAGDGLAAILNDPGNQNTRAITFPWVSIGRSHLRPVNDFAWYGTRYQPFAFGGTDQAGYVAEQMLSSTLFRIYQAAGGDSNDRNVQNFAAAYVAFLIIKAIGMMSTVNNPQRPEGYADLLMQADTGKFKYRGQEVEIGVLRKVIRWAFEKQGAYRQPPSAGQTPTNQAGNPPSVDVFVNDGRDGNYQFTQTLDSNDVWNRLSPDSGTVHQAPVVGQSNFLYVRVSNRGLSQATNVEVRGFQSAVPSNQVWPIDWEPLDDAVIASATNIFPGNSIVIGPFKWTPMSTQPALLVSVAATGDPSNLNRFPSANPIATRQLVLLDNNLAQRSMTTA